jgi:Collagen triple helix repeat (20 copies)
MFSRIHSKFGTAGLVVAIVALVVALTGAAFAGGLNRETKKEIQKQSKKFSKKFSKTFSQKFAKPGPAGPQGPAGLPGAAGAKGDTGDKGDQGDPGTNGTNGTNGEDGACSTGNPSCVVPSEATLKGHWGTGLAQGLGIAVISFGLALESEPALVYVKTAGEHEAECPGSTTEPKAEPGSLCVYQEVISGNYNGGEADALGALFTIEDTGTGAYGWGTWAVTAE